MSTTKTLIATGVSSGIGLEAIKQLLGQPQGYKFILGVRSPAKVQEALEQLGYDKSKHSVSILECDFADLQQVKGFAEQAFEKLGNDKLDELLLNHAIIKPTSETPGPRGSKWDEAYIVNHLSHHYLVHLLRPAIERSGTRIVYVSSEVFAGVTDASALRPKQLAGAGTHFYDLYCTTKLSQLLGALWWSRTFGDKASIVAVSPGMVNGTGLGRHFLQPGEAPKERPGANDLAAGTKLILAGFTRDDLLKDPSSIFLTAQGEWWNLPEKCPVAVEHKVQDGFAPSKEEIEKEENIH